MTGCIIFSLYVLVGGGCAHGAMQSQAMQQSSCVASNPVGAFVLIVGTMVLWPLLILLAIDQALSQ